VVSSFASAASHFFDGLEDIRGLGLGLDARHVKGGAALHLRRNPKDFSASASDEYFFGLGAVEDG
jgi:hypothetical protein